MAHSHFSLSDRDLPWRCDASNREQPLARWQLVQAQHLEKRLPVVVVQRRLVQKQSRTLEGLQKSRFPSCSAKRCAVRAMVTKQHQRLQLGGKKRLNHSSLSHSMADSICFDVARLNQAFPSRKFRSLIGRELFWRVGHNFKTQLQQFRFHLGIVQRTHNGRMQFGLDV